ncbi:tetratricopeptide repeat protein [Kitasatospora fiedleri]|uniref:tetratricopeptide repeat protein n=1 Tax=Kitasatospora fiedleri TaxID=2991545 RepID=UPI00249ACD5E|nr:tetratricopeptide repeat protein [Kitasatospora fiedleri]
MKKKTRSLIVLGTFVVFAAGVPLVSGAEFPPLYVALPAIYGGLVTGNLLTQCGLALLAGPAGLVPIAYSLGFGRVSRVLRAGSRPLAVRSVPLPVVSGAYQLVSGPRARTWAGMTAAYVPALVLGGWLLATARGGWWVFGLMVAVPLLLELALQARFPGCPGWVVFRLPTASPEALAEARTSPGQRAASLALTHGRPAEAVAVLAAEPESGTLHDGMLRVRALLAVGEWAGALERAERITAAGPVAHLGWAAALVRAEALVCAAEAGLLPPTEYLPRLAAQGAALEQRLLRSPVRADLLRLRGEREEAVKAAGQALRMQPDPLTAANAECSLAAALFAAGRPDQARRALERARKLFPALARIALVEGRAAAVVLD